MSPPHLPSPSPEFKVGFGYAPDSGCVKVAILLPIMSMRRFLINASFPSPHMGIEVAV